MELAITFFTAVSNLILGLFTYYKNPKSATNRLLAFLAVQISVWAILNYLSLHAATESATLFWIRIDMLPGAPMGPTLYLLVNSFPGRNLSLSRSKLIAIALFVILTMVLAVSPYMFTTAVFEGANIKAVPGPAIIIFIINFIGFSLLAFINLIKKLKSSSGLERAQIKYLLFGIIATFTLIATTDLLGVVALKSSFFVPFGPLYSLILIGSISYSIVKHRFLDIRLVLARTVTYTLLVIVLGFIYGLSLFAAGRLLTNNIVVSTTLALIMALSFPRIRFFLERLTDKIFYKERYDSNSVLGQLSKVMSSTLDLDTLGHGILQILVKELRLTKAAFVLLDDRHISSVKSEGFSSNPDLDEKDIQLFSQTANTLVFEDLDNGAVKDILRELNLSVVVHLRSEGQQIGLLVLGEKESGDIYSQQDLQLLEIFAPEAAVAIQNSQSYEEIRRFNITLQEEIKKATSDLLSANEKLVQLDKIKDEFVYLASHELRTPMTAIKSYVWLMLNNRAGTIGPKSQKYLNIVYSSTERLIHMVNEMLDLSRIESGKIQLQRAPFDLTDLFTQLKNEFQARLSDHKLTLQTICDPKITNINADRDKVLQVLENLVGNSVKFTSAGGRITVSAIPAGKVISISITDTGQGISEADMPKLFAKFGRLDGSLTSLPESGTGLGLYLTKQYVELHGGQIDVKSTPDKGSTFTFTIPIV